MTILQEHSLRNSNTLGIAATADWFITYETLEDLDKLLSDEYFQECRYIHIGEGSNMLFLTNFHGIVLKSLIKGITCVQDTNEEVILRVGAGEIWDTFVAYCVEHNYYGAENLSAIPGQVGAAAIQNIGAYGAEVENLIDSVEAINRKTKERRSFSRKECAYAYRDSIFKYDDYADWIVLYVHLRLSKLEQFNLSYAGLQDYLDKKALSPSLMNIRQAVIDIRASKLPDYKELGNAGSFFKNPIVSRQEAQRLSEEYHQIPLYPIDNEARTKLSAGWLIEQCGFKGYREGDAGVYEKQALILVNHGEASGSDISALAHKIQKAVQEKFGVNIEPEVRYIS